MSIKVLLSKTTKKMRCDISNVMSCFRDDVTPKQDSTICNTKSVEIFFTKIEM